jgi:hypothetical protein
MAHETTTDSAEALAAALSRAIRRLEPQQRRLIDNNIDTVQRDVESLVIHYDPLLRYRLAWRDDSLTDVHATDDAEHDESGLAPVMSLAEADAALARLTVAGDENGDVDEMSEMLTGADMADYLGTSRQTIDNWRKAGRIIALDREVRGRLYPKTQIVEIEAAGHRARQLVSGLDAVIDNLGNGWPAWVWLTNPRNDLDNQTPLDRLRAGDQTSVATALLRDDLGDFG